jgi:hypothetical protein
MEAESCWNGGLSLDFETEHCYHWPANGEQICVVSLGWESKAISQIRTVACQECHIGRCGLAKLC